MNTSLVKLATNDFEKSSIQVPHEICCLCARDTEMEYFWGQNILSPDQKDLIAIHSCHYKRSHIENGILDGVKNKKVCWALLYPANHQRYNSLYWFARDSEVAYGGNFTTDNRSNISAVTTRLFTIPYFLSLHHYHPDTEEMVRHLRKVLPSEYINGAYYAFIVMIVFEDASPKKEKKQRRQ